MLLLKISMNTNELHENEVTGKKCEREYKVKRKLDTLTNQVKTIETGHTTNTEYIMHTHTTDLL